MQPFPAGHPPLFLTLCSCRITTTSPLIVSDQTRQIGRRMVSQGNLGHRDGKGAEENIMAGAPLKHADSWQMSIHKMTKAPCVKTSATSASPWETNCPQLSVKILFFFSGNYCRPWFSNHRIACTLHLWVFCILVVAATPCLPILSTRGNKLSRGLDGYTQEKKQESNHGSKGHVLGELYNFLKSSINNP